MHAEFVRLHVVDLRTDEVGRQQVGRKLYAVEIGVDGFGRCFDEQRLGETGHAFEQDVAVCQQRNQDAFDQAFLTDHVIVDFSRKSCRKIDSYSTWVFISRTVAIFIRHSQS